jgi:hypothetical protein
MQDACSNVEMSALARPETMHMTIYWLRTISSIALLVTLRASFQLQAAEQQLDLTQAVVVVSAGERGQAETMAATILVEEVAKRTNITLKVQTSWPGNRQPVIAIATRSSQTSWHNRIPPTEDHSSPQAQPEGFLIHVAAGNVNQSPAVFIVGADSRGAMYGVGQVLRTLQCKAGQIAIDSSFRIATAPEYPARGHEMGYRARANTYDAWSPEQYDQYIREQIMFGMNCVQGIPFEDSRSNDLMKITRNEMNRTIGEICVRYDVDYWVWTPVDFSLTDNARRQEELRRHEEFYRSTPRLDAVFVPGGDPGSNPPELVLLFMEDLARLLTKHHPKAKVWMSLQDFNEPKIRTVMDYISGNQPDWLGGIVADTSALSLGETRLRLPERYPVRWYPDITHTVECQYPVNWWDPAYAVTLGREPTNPRPDSYATIIRRFAPHTDGFVTYSDGINDDVNKAIWSMLGWNSQQDVRDLLIQYSRLHFGDAVAEPIADGLLGLENNWRGSLVLNTGVDGILALWQNLETGHPQLLGNWRFQQHLMRACYDAYTRHRLIYENRLEREALQLLKPTSSSTPDTSMLTAEEVLSRAINEPCRPRLRTRIDELSDTLFKSIGYQTSVERYSASGAERGCVMDFVDRPLNDRWWLKNEFTRIRKLDSEQEKLDQLEIIRKWKAPGLGSFYDDIGHVGQSPHVIRGETNNTDPECRRHANPGHSWISDGKSKRRLAWLHAMQWPVAVDYDGLDPNAGYIVRLTGQGESPLRGNGIRLPATKQASKVGEFQEFAVPAALIADGRLSLTWDEVEESHLHWSQHSHVAEVWLLKQ